MKTIKIAKVPGVVREVVVDDTAKLGDALDVYATSFNEEVANYEMRVGDTTVSRDYIPADGAKIYLVLMIKGNAQL